MNSERSPKLGKYVRVKHGFAFKGVHFTEDVRADVLLTPANFSIGGGFQDARLKYYAGPVPDGYVLQPGDLVITMTDLSKAADTLGYPALIPSSTERRYLHNQRIGLVEICHDAPLDKRFLFYRLRADDYRHHILATASGSTVHHTSPNRVYEFRTALPPLDEQRAIASVLGALDNKIEQNRQTAGKLERLARAIFRAWFVDFEPVKAKAAGADSFPSMPQHVFDSLPTRFIDSEIGPVPQRWEVKALSTICTLVSGGTPRRSNPSYWSGDVPWYSVKDAPREGEIWVIDTHETITQEGLAESAARLIPRGCTIISARGTIGKLAMAGMPMAFNQSCYGLWPRDGNSFRYLHLLAHTVVAELQRRTHGSVFDTITRATFDRLMIVSPRSSVLLAFEELVAPFFDLLLASLQESVKLAELRDYVLPQLLSGQIRSEVADG